MPVTHGVAGSSPVQTALKLKGIRQLADAFFVMTYLFVYYIDASGSPSRPSTEKTDCFTPYLTRIDRKNLLCMTDQSYLDTIKIGPS